MRTCLTAATMVALLFLGIESVAWAQSSAGRSTGLSSSGNTGSSTNQDAMSVSGPGTSGRSGSGRESQVSLLGGQVQDIQISTTPLQPGEFVGADVQDVRDTMARTGAQRGTGQGRSGLSAFDSSPFGRALQALSGGLGSSYGARRTTEIRARMRTAFTVPRTAPGQVGSKLAQRLEKSSWIETHSPMEVKIEGGTAVLRGVVATEHDRAIAGRMAMLEPGVRQVDNQLEVQPTPSPSDAVQ